MHTKESLDSTHWKTLKNLAEEFGFEYTTKDETIAAILEAQSKTTVAEKVEPVVEPVSQKQVVAPPKKTEAPKSVAPAKQQKARYSLSGVRLN